MVGLHGFHLPDAEYEGEKLAQVAEKQRGVKSSLMRELELTCDSAMAAGSFLYYGPSSLFSPRPRPRMNRGRRRGRYLSKKERGHSTIKYVFLGMHEPFPGAIHLKEQFKPPIKSKAKTCFFFLFLFPCVLPVSSLVEKE